MNQTHTALAGQALRQIPSDHTLVISEGLLTEMQLTQQIVDKHGESRRPLSLGNGVMAIHNDVLSK